MMFEPQPMTIYLGLAIAGIFTGIGITIGGLIVKYWIEPRIKKIHKNHKKLKKTIKSVLKEEKLVR